MEMLVVIELQNLVGSIIIAVDLEEMSRKWTLPLALRFFLLRILENALADNRAL